MNRFKLLAILALLAIGTYVLMGSIYTVSEVEQAIITQFGEPVGAPVTTAGLKFKVPFIQDVNLIDKRVLEWDGNPSVCQPKISSTSRSTSSPAGGL
jgi:membrane protease subunit HflC